MTTDEFLRWIMREAIQLSDAQAAGVHSLNSVRLEPTLTPRMVDVFSDGEFQSIIINLRPHAKRPAPKAEPPKPTPEPEPPATPTEEGRRRYPPDGLYDGEACTCTTSCPDPCKGYLEGNGCKCDACGSSYGDALSVRED